jgi:hypothetical protein
MLQSLHDTRYLGWSEVGTGNLVASGAHVGVETTGTHVVWLDRELQRESDVEIGEMGYGTVNRVWWLDPNHAVLQHTENNLARLELVDFRKRSVRHELGTYPYVSRVELEPALHQLAVVDSSTLRRFAVDLEADTVVELPALEVASSVQAMRLLDPARSDGAIALVASYDDDGERLTTYLADAKPGARTKKLRGKKGKALDGGLLGIAPDGLLYVRDPDGLHTVRGGKTVIHFPKGEISDLIIPEASGARVASIHGGEVAMFLADGTLVWKQNLWGAANGVFSTDGTRLVLRTSGGIVALDAATGERRAVACGFSFGLMTKTPPANALNVRPVCEDPRT